MLLHVALCRRRMLLASEGPVVGLARAAAKRPTHNLLVSRRGRRKGHKPKYHESRPRTTRQRVIAVGEMRRSAATRQRRSSTENHTKKAPVPPRQTRPTPRRRRNRRWHSSFGARSQSFGSLCHSIHLAPFGTRTAKKTKRRAPKPRHSQANVPHDDFTFNSHLMSRG